jgi:tetratricopeptide (TPR) repeat protein
VLLAAAQGMLAEALYQLDRLDEAETLIGRAEKIGAADAWTAAVLRLVRAKLLARRGSSIEAERLARELTEFFDGRDVIERQGEAYAVLADVLLLAGKTEEAARALEEALHRYERKGSLVLAGRVRTRLEEARSGRVVR